MKKLLTVTFVLALMISSVMAIGYETGVGVVVEPEQFAPRVFLDPDSRILYDDYNEPGAVSPGGDELIERVENYAFEGEQIIWDVLVWDKNGKEKIEDVYVRLNRSFDTPDDIEANCDEQSWTDLRGLAGLLFEGEEVVTWNVDTMRWYTCTLTVEPPQGMATPSDPLDDMWHGEYFVAAVACDLNGQCDEFAENELWFFNPVVSLGLSGTLNFGVVRPGATVISDPLVLTNAAEAGSGVLLDMFIAGTDFYDPAHSGAMCPDSNVLRLNAFRYHAVSGAYDTCLHPGPGNVLDPGVADAQCYVGIPYYVDGAGDPGNNNFQRIIAQPAGGPYFPGNILSPGADMVLNFKLALPEPCNGGPFTSGEFKFFGEAV